MMLTQAGSRNWRDQKESNKRDWVEWIMQILAISDTHGHTDPEILELCKQADEVWHAGDIGPGVIEMLEKSCKVLRIVRGNADPKQTAPDELEFSAGGLRVRLLHHFTPSQFSSGNLTGRRPDVLVCGHTHILEIRRDAAGMLIINPGACGRYGILKARTVIRFEITDGQIKRADVIELDAPDREQLGTEQAHDGYWTVKEFAAQHQRRLEAAEAMAVGKLAVATCRESGLEIRKKAEGQFLVNSYPEAALRLAFEQFVRLE
jgi:uncharacterized protein